MLSSSYSLSYNKLFLLIRAWSSSYLSAISYTNSELFVSSFLLSSLSLLMSCSLARSQLSMFIWSIVVSTNNLLSSFCSLLIFHTYLFFSCQFFYVFFLHILLLPLYFVLSCKKWKSLQISYKDLFDKRYKDSFFKDSFHFI